jgi:hypothetical protein
MNKIIFTIRPYTYGRVMQVKEHFSALGYITHLTSEYPNEDKMNILDSDMWIYDWHTPLINDNLEHIRELIFNFKGKFILSVLDDGGSFLSERIKDDIFERIDAIIIGCKHPSGYPYASEKAYEKMIMFPRYVISNRKNKFDGVKLNKIFFMGAAHFYIKSKYN